MRSSALLLTTLLHYSCLIAADSPTKFFGPCVVSIGGETTFRTVCMSEDMRTPGQNNRFRIVMLYPPKSLAVPRVADYVRTEATTDGHMRVSTLAIGHIDITPRDLEIRESMRHTAPSWEIRPHYVTLSTLDDGSLELLIEEPYGTFTGAYTSTSPSQEWLLDNLRMLQTMSRAH